MSVFLFGLNVHFVSSRGAKVQGWLARSLRVFKVQSSIALRAFKVGWRVPVIGYAESSIFERSTAESKNLRLFFRI